MRKIALLCSSLAAMLALALPVTPAHAQTPNITSFVSGTGNDVNNTCGDPRAPCARFQQALPNTENNTYGIFANGMGSIGTITVQVKDSVVANNAFNGISAFTGQSMTATAAGHSTTSITVDRSSSLLNGADGILAQGANGFVILGNSTVISNVTGLHSVNGGSIFSYQNNQLTGNVTDGAPTGVLALR